MKDKKAIYFRCHVGLFDWFHLYVDMVKFGGWTTATNKNHQTRKTMSFLFEIESLLLLISAIL